MRRRRRTLGTALLFLLLGPLLSQAQSLAPPPAPPTFLAGQAGLADIARESKQKRQESTRKVWTNDDLGMNFPEIKLLGPPRQHPPSLAPFKPTPMATVRRMLETANVQPGEMVFDIGSGDGRIVIMAAETFGARAVGIELNEALVAESRRAVAAKGLEDRVKIIQANALDVDLSPADVVTLYLTPDGIELLRPHLERTLRPGTRVVVYVDQIPGWTLDWRLGEDPWQDIFFYRAP